MIDNGKKDTSVSDKAAILNDGSYAAIAVVGDQFWNKGRSNEFCLASAVQRDFKTMNDSFHNIDHDRGIKSLVGIHRNTEYDPLTKQMIIHVYPREKFYGYSTWKDFIDTCRELGQIPNVSIEAIVKEEQWDAKDLRDFVDIEQYGFKDDDKIWVEVEYLFVGAATVNTGACDDEDGCGFFSQIEQIHNNEINESIGECKVCTDTDIEEGNMTEEIKDEANIDEIAVRDRKIEALKERLVGCGKLRADLELKIEELSVEEAPEPVTIEPDTERISLEERILELEEQVRDKDEKLSKPVTRKPTAPQETDNTGLKALEFLARNKIGFNNKIKY